MELNKEYLNSLNIFNKLSFDSKKYITFAKTFKTKYDRPLLLPMFKLLVVIAILSIVIPILWKSRVFRTPLAGTTIGSYLFCFGENLCSDARCVGETFKECRVCPTGTARSVYKVSCDKQQASKCKFDDNKCDDRSIFNR